MKVRDGIYLEDDPPARQQFRWGRRDPIKPVIVVHTAESGTDLEGLDVKAENVASFISERTTVGSYHLVGDADSIIQLIRFENEAFHDRTGSNRWAIGISLAMNAADWPIIRRERRTALVRSAAHMAVLAADWLERNGYGRPDARLLTKGESNRRDASGFISHARRDPGRRTDPGRHFPWDEFFDLYQQGVTQVATIEVPDPHVQAIQKIAASKGYDPGPIDGIPGPRTHAAVEKMANAPTRMADEDDLRDAGRWREYAKAHATLMNLRGVAERGATS